MRRVFSATSASAYSYDPYGNALQATALITDFGYAGMFYNADSGLYLTQYRAYDPAVGRWLSRDPFGEVSDSSANLYAYVGNNPIADRDPSGRFGLVGAAIGGVAGGIAGYETGGGRGAAIGAAVGAVVGAVAPEASESVGAAAARFVGSRAAGVVVGATTASVVNGVGGATAAFATNLVEGNPALNDVGPGFAIGLSAPLLSGESILVGVGGAAKVGLPAWADYALAGQTGIFGAIGAAGDALARSGCQ